RLEEDAEREQRAHADADDRRGGAHHDPAVEESALTHARFYDSMPRMWLLFWPAIAFVVGSGIALLFRAALLRALRGWFGGSQGISAFLTGIRLPSILWCFVLGFFVAIDMVELPRGRAVSLRTSAEAALIPPART